MAIRLTVLLQHICPTMGDAKGPRATKPTVNPTILFQVISGICYSSRKLTNPKVNNSKATTAVPDLLFYNHIDVLQLHRCN